MNLFIERWRVPRSLLKDSLYFFARFVSNNTFATKKKDYGPLNKGLFSNFNFAEPLLVLIEYVPYGDLLGYLRKSRGLNDTYYNDPDIKPQTNLTSQQLMKFAWQIADGMSYLSSRPVRILNNLQDEAD